VTDALLQWLPMLAALHVAVATSAATIIPTSIASSRSHARRGSVDRELLARWSLPTVLVALFGALAASHVDARVLAAVFGCGALAVALKMMLPLDHVVLRRTLPGGPAGTAIPVTVGAVAAMMDIGGGVLSVPAMTPCGEPMHKAVGTGSALGLRISAPATLVYLFAPAPDAADLPLTVGYVSLLAFAVIAPASWLIAPLGARLAHSIPRRWLSVVFGVFLLIVAARMLQRTLG